MSKLLKLKATGSDRSIDPSAAMPICEPLAGAQSTQRGEGEYFLEFEISGLPRTPNAREHFMAKAKHVAEWKRKVYAKAWPHKPASPLAQARITFTRCSSNRPDYDNLVSSFKACMDGLRQARVIVDDKYSNVGRPEYLWEKCAPKLGHIKIKIEGVTE